MKALKILYFTEGPTPTPEQYEQASNVNGNVCFRNAKLVGPETNGLEDCDGVMGEVPEVYGSRFPDAKEVIQKRSDDLAKMTRKIGEKPAPTKTRRKPGEVETSDINHDGRQEPVTDGVSDPSVQRADQPKANPDPETPPDSPDARAPEAGTAPEWSPQGGANK